MSNQRPPEDYYMPSEVKDQLFLKNAVPNWQASYPIAERLAAMHLKLKVLLFLNCLLALAVVVQMYLFPSLLLENQARLFEQLQEWERQPPAAIKKPSVGIEPL